MSVMSDTLLTPQQLAAVDALATGRNVTSTAEAVKVSRQTVSEWLHHDAAFQAALNMRRQELWNDSADRLRSMVPQALDELGRWFRSHKGLEAAVHVLKAAGVYNLPVPTDAGKK